MEFNLNELIQKGIRNGGTPGIDVPSYQDTIDWDKVKKTGIKYVIFRTTVRNGWLNGFKIRI